MAIPTPHVLGLSGDNTAAQLFMHAGDSIVQSLRRTGENIERTVLQNMTNRELKGFGQEASTLDPNSPTFVPALLGLAGKYPMAAQSPAGRAIIETSLIPAQQNFLLTRDARNNAANLAEAQARNNGGLGSRYKQVPGVGLVDTWAEGGPSVAVATPEKTRALNEGQSLVDAQGNVIVAPRARTTATPYTASNGMVVDTTTGGFTPLPLNANQQATLDQKVITEGRQKAIGEIKALDDDIARAITETRDTEDEGRLRDLQNRIDNARSRKDALLNALGGVPIQGPSQGAIDPLSTPGLGGGITPATPMVPDAASPILPPPGAIKKLDVETARKIRQEVGGDKEKARARARELGYTP